MIQEYKYTNLFQESHIYIYIYIIKHVKEKKI